MRLIDADALHLHKVRGEIGNLSGDFVPGYIIAEAKTVDAEPVRHGKWSEKKKFGDVYCCSECGFGLLVSNHFMYRKGCIARGDNRTNYCPNCGAKMGLEDENAVKRRD